MSYLPFDLICFVPVSMQHQSISTCRIDHPCQAESLGHNLRSLELWGAFVLTASRVALSPELVVLKVNLEGGRWEEGYYGNETLQVQPPFCSTIPFTNVMLEKLPLCSLTPSAKSVNTSFVSQECGRLLTFCLITRQFEALSVGFSCLSPKQK